MRLYAFGSNGSGQLGIGSLEDKSIPQLCEFTTYGSSRPSPSGVPIKIAAGGNATYVVLGDGIVYRAGQVASLSKERLGAKSQDFRRFEMIRSSSYHSTRLCSTTWDAVIFVEGNDGIFVEGAGPAGELGLGPNIKDCAESTKLQDLVGTEVRIVDIASCVSHTVIVLSNGEVWGWGNGRKGQLGEPAEMVWEPRKVRGIGFDVVRAVCGREFTFLVAEPFNGRHLILGSDKWSIKSGAPKDLQGWKEIGATWGSLYVLQTSGAIRSWGRNDRGQLAPPDLPIIEQIAVGSEHVLALTKDGKVVSWGWGEHGNCGENTDNEGNVNGRWNVIPSNDIETSERIVGVGAGCATSFFWVS